MRVVVSILATVILAAMFLGMTLGNVTAEKSVEGQEESKAVVRYAKIKPTDSEEIKQKKAMKNELLDQLELLKPDMENLEDDERHMTARRKAIEIAKQIEALGLDPLEDVPEEEIFLSLLDGFLSDSYVFQKSFTDDYGNVKPRYQEEYNKILLKREKLENLKNEFEEGSITAQHGIENIAEMYNSTYEEIRRIYTPRY